MKPVVMSASVEEVIEYIELNKSDSEEPWVQAVLDAKTAKLILLNGSYAKQRKAYGLWLGSNMVGYAVVHLPSQTLDLLHVAEEYQGRGLGKYFLSQLDVVAVVLDARNVRATNLYTQFGYELEFFGEENELSAEAV